MFSTHCGKRCGKEKRRFFQRIPLHLNQLRLFLPQIRPLRISTFPKHALGFSTIFSTFVCFPLHKISTFSLAVCISTFPHFFRIHPVEGKCPGMQGKTCFSTNSHPLLLLYFFLFLFLLIFLLQAEIWLSTRGKHTIYKNE